MQVHGLSEDGNRIVLDRFTGGVSCRGEPGEDPRTLVVVDVETTGLDPNTDKVIEFAAAILQYNEAGEIVGHSGTYSWLGDPGEPLSPTIVRVTGLTDADLAGQEIPNDKVSGVFKVADFVISHNAAFDWSFCRRRWDAVDGLSWGCSMSQVDWFGLGFPAAKQEILTRYHGFFYDAHRATIDVEALVKLLQMRPAADQPTYLKTIIDYNATARYRVLAWGAPFAVKDTLKERGYRWDGDRRVWWTTVTDAEREWTWIEDLYTQFHARRPPEISRIDPRQQWA